MFRTRSVIAVTSTILVVLCVVDCGLDLVWLAFLLPSVLLLPVFAIAALTKAYSRAVTFMIWFQCIAMVAIGIATFVLWFPILPPLISAILGIVALRSKENDEVRLAASIPAACVVPGVVVLIDPTTFVFVTTLGIAGYLWYRDARRRHHDHGVDPHAMTDLELPRAIAIAA